MLKNKKMTKYELYLCDVSGDHKPIVKFESDLPFISVAVGDRFDDHGWVRLDGIGKIASVNQPKMYTVHSIKHTVLQGEKNLKIQYWINLEPHFDDSSPAWK